MNTLLHLPIDCDYILSMKTLMNWENEFVSFSLEDLKTDVKQPSKSLLLYNR